MKNKNNKKLIAISVSLMAILGSSAVLAEANNKDNKNVIREEAKNLSKEYSRIKTQTDLLRLQLEEATLKDELERISGVNRDKLISDQKTTIDTLNKEILELKGEIENLNNQITELQKEEEISERIPLSLERLSLVKINGLSKNPIARMVIDGVSEKNVVVGDEIIPGVKLIELSHQSAMVLDAGVLHEMLLQPYPTKVVPKTGRGLPSNLPEPVERPNPNSVVELFNNLQQRADQKDVPRLKSGKKLEFYKEF